MPVQEFLRHTKIAAICATVLLLPATAMADPIGRWKTIDDETSQPKSIVEISRNADGVYTGRIIELINPSRPDPVCNECKDDRRNQPITGMEIIRGMRANGNEYSGGTILKPDEGKVYRSKMKLIENGSQLEVSGCIAVFCKSQVWLRQ